MGIGTLRRYHGAPKVDQPVAAVPDAPKKSDNAEAWKTYAAARGWDATATKAKIIEQYEADLEAHSNEGDERVVSTPTGSTTETVPDGSVTPSEPAPVGEAEQRDRRVRDGAQPRGCARGRCFEQGAAHRRGRGEHDAIRRDHRSGRAGGFLRLGRPEVDGDAPTGARRIDRHDETGRDGDAARRQGAAP